jgi:hypothetical protein
VISIAQGFQREVTADDEGGFVVSFLPPGNYSVKTERDGFAPTEIRDVTLNVNDRVRLSIQLKVGSIGQTVDVRENASLINESMAVGTLVNRQFVENLPLNGRSFQSLIALTPGVVLTKATLNEQGQFSVNGQRASANYFTVDGVGANIGVSPSANAGQSTAGSLPGLSASGGTNNLVSVDALQEFQILTSSFAPEFGRTPGAQVLILTRSGTNDFHGTLFDYLRNSALEANDWFANANRVSRPATRQNDFGGVLGGPVLLPRFGDGGRQPWYDGHNRTFFFLSYEGLRLRLPNTLLTTVPSMDARAQAASQVPQVAPYLNVYPRPNGPDVLNAQGQPTGFTQFNVSVSNPSTLDATSIRIDHVISKKLAIFGRYNHAPSELDERGAGPLAANTVTLNQFKTQTLTGGATLVISTDSSNDFRANYSRSLGRVSFVSDNFGGAALPPANSVIFPQPRSSQDSFFGLNLSGGTKALWRQGEAQFNLQRQVNLVDTLSIVLGGHQLKFGVDYRRLTPVFDSARYTQTVTFNGVTGNPTAALSGRATRASLSAYVGERHPIFVNFSLFGQDIWRVAPRLTITYGVRWDVNPAPSEANGNAPLTVTHLDNPSTLSLAPSGTRLFKTTYDNFAPRIGIAYQLSKAKGRETMLRGGFGVFYDLGTGPAASAFGTGAPNFASKVLPTPANPSGVLFPLDPGSASSPVFSLAPPVGTLWGIIDPNFKLPYTYHWNLTVEQSLGSNQTVSVGYVAAAGRRLLRQELIQNPNQNFTTVVVTRNAAISDYQSMQLQYRRRLSRGLQALASYTWSHSLDNASADTTFEAPEFRIDVAKERGPSTFDIRHSFSSAITYDIPSPIPQGILASLLRDFSIDTIFAARSAGPVNIVTGAAPLGGFTGSDSVSRPDLIAGVPLYTYDPSFAGGRRINKTAFDSATPTAALRQGTLGRNALRGFGMWQVDMALRREFKLTERFKVQFRAETFNMFNHPNFGDPGAGGNGTTVLTSQQFGQSTNMLGRSLGAGGVLGGFNPLYQVGGPRSMQLALKLLF